VISVYNMGDKYELSAEIQVNFFQLGNIDLLNRPKVSASSLEDAGWTNAGTGQVTLYTTTYQAGETGITWDQNIIIHITPIKPDGTIVGPDDLDDYVDGLLEESTIADVLTADYSGDKLVIWIQPVQGSWESGQEYGALYDDLLHRLQDVYYKHNYNEFPTEAELKEFNPEISVFPSFDGIGNAVLIPTSCKIRNVAAGNYDLSMDHPIDPDGKWAHLQPEAIIKAPIPAELIENAYAGLDVDVYKTTSQAALREGPSEPSPISYTAWVSGTSYAVGSKVTSSGKNYQLNEALTGNEIYQNPGSSRKWREIANRTAGSPVLIQLKKGQDLYYVSGPDSGWYKMSTPYGLEGYIKASQVVYDRHLSPSQTKDRIVTDQLFRIKKVTVNTKQMTVSVNAEHVSYDLNGVLIDNVNIVRKSPAQAIAMIEDAFMIPYQGTIASNITDTTDKSYTAEISGRNGTFALLDPDKGVVAQFEAAYRRDNWDLFVMEKNATDQGFRITYGNNMLGVNWNINRDQLITRIVPVAKDENGDSLYVSDTVKWIDSDRINDYPVVRMERLKVDGQVGKDDGTETDTNWTTETLRAEMTKRANARFSVDKVDQLKHEITIDFVRLGDTAEYQQFKDLQNVRLYDTVIAIDPRVDLSVSVQVTEIEFDAVNERVTAMKLSNIEGYNLRNTAGFNVLNNSITSDKLTDDVSDSIIENVSDEANDYTDSKVSEASQSIRTWVTNNFQPIATT